MFLSSSFDIDIRVWFWKSCFFISPSKVLYDMRLRREKAGNKGRLWNSHLGCFRVFTEKLNSQVKTTCLLHLAHLFQILYSGCSLHYPMKSLSIPSTRLCSSFSLIQQSLPCPNPKLLLKGTETADYLPQIHSPLPPY